jgi:hypothetical protein
VTWVELKANIFCTLGLSPTDRVVLQYEDDLLGVPVFLSSAATYLDMLEDTATSFIVIKLIWQHVDASNDEHLSHELIWADHDAAEDKAKRLAAQEASAAAWNLVLPRTCSQSCSEHVAALWPTVVWSFDSEREPVLHTSAPLARVSCHRT